MNENTMPPAPAATHVHETMSEDAFCAFADGWSFTTFGDMLYSHVEYMNSPHGLIVLAHHNNVSGQVDGIHPASLSHSIDRPNNIIEPLKARDGTVFAREPVAYNSHWITRRSQGGLVLAGFGRMIDGGDPEAHCVEAPKGEGFTMTVYETPSGPVIGAFYVNGRVVHVIRPTTTALVFEAIIQEYREGTIDAATVRERFANAIKASPALQASKDQHFAWIDYDDTVECL